MNNTYENINEYNPNKKCKIAIKFDMITQMLSNKKLQPIVREIFIKSRKTNISLVFTTQSYFILLSTKILN